MPNKILKKNLATKVGSTSSNAFYPSLSGKINGNMYLGAKSMGTTAWSKKRNHQITKLSDYKSPVIFL